MSALPLETAPALEALSPARLVGLARSFGPLRSCTAAQAPVLRLAGRHDRGVLPRWQRAGDGHHEYAPPAAYAAMPAWRSREHWLTVVVPAVLRERPDRLRGVSGRTRWGVAPATMLRYLEVLSLHAHRATGRRCIVRPDRLAELAGLTKRTVQRCQKAAEALGLYVVVSAGRMLTAEETYAVRARGSRQRGLSNEAALTVPSWLPRATAWAAPRTVKASSAVRTPHLVDVTPTSGGYRKSEIHQVHGSLTRRSAGDSEPPPAARPLEKRGPGTAPVRNDRFSGGVSRNGTGRGRDQRAMRLAFDLVDLLPWLRGTRPGRLEPGLRRFARAGEPWTAADVVSCVDDRNHRLGRASMTFDLVRNPHALLASYLRDLDVVADHPRFDGAFFTPASPGAMSRSSRGARDRNRARLEAARLRGASTPAVREAGIALVRETLARASGTTSPAAADVETPDVSSDAPGSH